MVASRSLRPIRERCALDVGPLSAAAPHAGVASAPRAARAQLVNLSATLIAALPLYDLVATYSRGTVSHFQRLGARQVAFVPLAADP